MDEMKKVIFLLFVFFTTYVFSNNCKSFYLYESQIINYKNSDLVFICKSKNGKLQVLEIFKGNLEIKKDYIYQSDFMINDNDLLIIYANKDSLNNDKVLINSCSLSRSFNDLQRIVPFILDYSFPGLDIEKSEIKQEVKILNDKLLRDLKFEILLLRKQKHLSSNENKIDQNLNVPLKYLMLFAIFIFLYTIILIRMFRK